MNISTRLSIGLSVCLASFSIAAQPNLTQTLVGPGQDLGRGDSYGMHVESTSEWLAIGAPRESVDFNGNGDPNEVGERRMGAVYIYKRTPGGLVLHQKLVGFAENDTIEGARFGAGIAIQGSWMFIGAANDNDFPGFVDPKPHPDFGSFYFAGKLFIFRYSAATDLWEDTGQRLISHAPGSGLQFAARTGSRHFEPFTFDGDDMEDAETDSDDSSDDSSDDDSDDSSDDDSYNEPSILLVGEPNNVGISTSRLNTFKLKHGVWERIQVLNSPSDDPDSFFADKIVRAGKFALVTESNFDWPIDIPLVHVYRVNPNGITKFKGIPAPVQTIAAPSGPDDRTVCGLVNFGSGLAASGELAVIANGCDNTAGPPTGAVYVYTVGNGNKSPLTLMQTLYNPHPGTTSYGYSGESGMQSLSTDGQSILVGTYDDIDVEVDLYERLGSGVFVLTESMATPDPGYTTTQFGISTKLMGDGQFTISRTGWFGQGGGKVYNYYQTLAPTISPLIALPNEMAIVTDGNGRIQAGDNLFFLSAGFSTDPVPVAGLNPEVAADGTWVAATVPQVPAGQYKVTVRASAATQERFFPLQIIVNPLPDAIISPISGTVGSLFTITDDGARIQPGDLAIFYMQGDNPANPATGIIAVEISITSGTALTAKVPALIAGMDYFITVRPTRTAPSRFNDLPFKVV